MFYYVLSCIIVYYVVLCSIIIIMIIIIIIVVYYSLSSIFQNAYSNDTSLFEYTCTLIIIVITSHVPVWNALV